MSVAQTYILTAAQDRIEEARAILVRMADAVRPLPGCESVIVIQDDNNPARFIFIESFVDSAAHEATKTMMPKDILSALGAVLAGPPDGSTYSFVATA